MDIIALIVVLVLIGAGLYLLKMVPMDARIRTVISVVAIAAVVIWVLQSFVAPALG